MDLLLLSLLLLSLLLLSLLLLSLLLLSLLLDPSHPSWQGVSNTPVIYHLRS
jgi:hypothetical protein